MQYKKKVFYFIVIILSLFLVSCDDTNNQTEVNKNIFENGEILDNSNYACYKIDNLNPELESGLVFYPVKDEVSTDCVPMDQAPSTEFSNRPVILITHGWNGSKESFLNQAKNFVKMGMIVMIYTTADHAKLINNPKNWTEAFEDMLVSLETETNLPNSPVYNKVNRSNLNLMAHSMGGGGLFHLFQKRDDLKINTVISLTPWKGTESNYLTKDKVNAKSFIVISGANDIVAYPSHQELYYSLLPDNIKKGLIVVNGAGHTDFGSSSVSKKPELDKFLVDWLKLMVYKVDADKTMYNASKIDELKNNNEVVKFDTNLF